MNTEFVANMARAAHYKRQAVRSLLPPEARTHADAIAREARALFRSLLDEADARTAERPASTRIDVE